MSATFETIESVHIFERSGLGKAPFRFIAGGRLPVSSSCDYCGMAIRNANRIKSSDGKFFKVGVECVNKTGDAGLIRRAKLVVNKAARVKRAEKKAKMVATVTSENADVLADLSTFPQGFQALFARDLEYRIKVMGKAPSKRQLAFLNKILDDRGF